VGQALGVLKWTYKADGESYVSLSIAYHIQTDAHLNFVTDGIVYLVNCWPSISTVEATCDVEIKYPAFYYVVSIPFPCFLLLRLILLTHSLPTRVPSSTWSLNHTLDWSIPRISNDNDDVAESTRSGTPAFSFNRNDLGTFFLVRVSFVAQEASRVSTWHTWNALAKAQVDKLVESLVFY
ncbi:hypothetical protein EDD16DRAFT_1822729, partial [Pisolithus croceorrhizus]